MSENRFYKEKLFYTTQTMELEEAHQQKITESFNENDAIGSIGGFYEEGYPVWFISVFALNVVKMDFEEFMTRTGGSYLALVCEQDRKRIQKSFLERCSGSLQYRLLDKYGEEILVNEVRKDAIYEDGRAAWISSVRIVNDSYKSSQLNSQAVQLLKDSYFRIAAINLSENTITDLKVVESEIEELAGIKGDYEKSILSCAHNHVSEEYREKFLSIMSAEYLLTYFAADKTPVEFTYKRLVNGEYKWVLSEIVPVDNFGEDNPNVMWYVKNISEEKAREAEMTEKLKKTNGELLKAKEELEKANQIISESNRQLRRTLDEEEQYRQAIISEAIFVFNVNVSKNLIESEFYEILEDGRRAVLPMVGLSAPCSADEFFRRWGETKVSSQDREVFLQTFNMENLLAAYARGENELLVEFESAAGKDNRPMVLRQMILLTKDVVSGEILALNSAKNITAQRQKELETRKALMDAYEAANRANSAKTDFLSRMSHDIRTPMNAIIGMTAIAGTHLDDKERVADCLGKITSASRHLLTLINEVLDMSKIESGKMTLHEEDFKLPELLDSLLNIIRPTAEEKNQQLVVRVLNIKHENVIGDSLRIQQAFVNIVSNSVKYTHEGGKITIDITERPSEQIETGCYEFMIEDTGIGMSPEFLEKIFDPFERAEDVRISKVQGTGLGMSITKNIIQMLGGDIKIESEIGVGTKFLVTVPLKYRESEDIGLDELAGLSVLVADDDEICGENTCNMLNELGMQSEWALSGEAAVEKAVAAYNEKRDYFAVILDWQMPNMDGLETAKEIRKVLGQTVPIIILSAYDWSEIEMEARKAGVDAFITKPLFKTRLVNVLRNLKASEKPCEAELPLSDMGTQDYSDRRVLLVEDNDLNREIATEILGLTGIVVEQAENGREAVDKVAAAEEGYYDLIFMDVQMPVMNGYDATFAIRALNRRDVKRIPIIAMTANTFVEDVQAAKSSGMNEHLAKPLDLQKLKQTLDKWL